MLEGRAIGGVGFHGPPDSDGVVEIGYGIAEPHRGHDCATEAVIAHCGLAIERGALAVIAKTDPANIASHRVLEKAGFVADRAVSDEALPELRFTRRAELSRG